MEKAEDPVECVAAVSAGVRNSGFGRRSGLRSRVSPTAPTEFLFPLAVRLKDAQRAGVVWAEDVLSSFDETVGWAARRAYKERHTGYLLSLFTYTPFVPAS